MRPTMERSSDLTRGQRSSLSGWRAAMAVGVYASVLIVAAGMPMPVAHAQDAGGEPSPDSTPTAVGVLEVLGTLDTPPEVASKDITVVAVDEEARRLYAHYPKDVRTDVFIEYDLITPVPTPLRRAVADFPGSIIRSSEGVALDPDGGRLFGLSNDLPERPQDAFALGRLLTVIDLESLSVERTYDLNAKVAPGFVPWGITYSQEDELLYLLGEMSGNAAGKSIPSDVGLAAASPVPMVVAIDPDTGDTIWRRPVPECQQLLITDGTLIARSSHRPALYFFCQPGSGPSGVEATYPGQPGLYRLNIEPGATQSDALGFTYDYFPISGSYFKINATGVAAFDRATDRFYAASLSAITPGAFVFDGRLEEWVGQVAALDNCANKIGVHPGLGRLYLGGNGRGLDCLEGRYGNGYVISSHGTATPPTQGPITEVSLESNIVADPATRRIFANAAVDGGETAVHVFEDLGQPAPRDPIVDHDSQTDDIPEGPGTRVTFSGGTGGFGTRVSLVGGWEAPLTAISNLRKPSELNLASLAFGDRGVTVADVRSVDIAGFGVTADAQTVTPDDGTDSDRQRFQQDLLGAGAADDSGEPPGCEDDVDGSDDGPRDPSCPLDWEHQPVQCSDGGGGVSEASQSGLVGAGETIVKCDLAEATGVARTSFGELGSEDAPGISVTDSHYDTTVQRVDGATVTDSRASAEGLQLQTPVGTLSIGRVAATAMTAAGGRTGTSEARWTRVISGIRVVDPTGAQLYPDPDDGGPTSCVTVVTASGAPGDDDGEESGADSCQQVVDAVNDLLEVRMEIKLPRPAMSATPKGAFARIRESDADFYGGQAALGDSRRDIPAVEVVFYHDTTEKSRTLVQFAAIRANSKYTISRFDGGIGTSDGAGIGQGFDATDGVKPDIGTGVDGRTVPGDPARSPASDDRLIEELTTFLSNVNPDALAQSGDALPPAGQDPNADAGTGGDLVGTSPFTDGLASGPSVGVGEPPALTEDTGGGDVPPPEVAAGTSDQPSQTDGGQPPQTLESRFISRGVGDAAAVGGIWLLFLGALATALRRTSLLQLLGSR